MRSREEKKPGKFNSEWSPMAHQMQLATIRAVVANIIEPIEAAGVLVDVIVQMTQPIRHKFLNKTVIQTYSEDVVRLLDGGKGRVIGFKFDPLVAIGRDTSQYRAYQSIFEMLERHVLETGKHYRSALLWRYDVVPFFPWATPTSSDGRPGVAADSRTRHKISPNHDSYLGWSKSIHAHHSGRIVHSLPGWAIPCWHQVFTNRTVVQTMRLHEVNDFNLESMKDRPVPIAVQSKIDELRIYRGRYGYSFFDGGEFCCRFLEEKHGGPACSRQSIAQSFCDESNIFGEFTVNLKALWQWMDHDEERRKKGPKMTLWQAKQLREWVGNDSSPDSLDKFLATC
jgi:hypothetical protein